MTGDDDIVALFNAARGRADALVHSPDAPIWGLLLVLAFLFGIGFGRSHGPNPMPRNGGRVRHTTPRVQARRSRFRVNEFGELE